MSMPSSHARVPLTTSELSELILPTRYGPLNLEFSCGGPSRRRRHMVEDGESAVRCSPLQPSHWRRDVYLFSLKWFKYWQDTSTRTGSRIASWMR